MPTLRAALLFGLVFVLFLGPRSFFADVPVYRDLMVLFLPLHTWPAEAFANGASLLWCPELFFGAPFFANYQSALLYPPTWLFFALPLPAAVGLYLAFHLVLGALGTRRLLVRVVGRSESAALFGALTFALGGFFVSLLTLTNQLAAAAWLPWVLVSADWLARSRDLRSLARLALLLGLPALVGAPETVLVTVAIAAVVAASQGEGARARTTAAALVIVSAALAAALAAAQLLPTFEYYRETRRSTGLAVADVARESLSLRSFEQLLLPPTFENGGPRLYPEGGVPLVSSLYVGVAPLALAIAAAFGGSLWTWMALASAFFASGAATPLLAVAHEIAPRLAGAFRYPAKLFLPAHLALAVLAAHGFDRAFDRTFARRILGVSAVLGLAGVIVAIAGSLSPGALLDRLGYELPAGIATGALEILGAPLAGLGRRLALLAATTAFLVLAAGRGWIGAPFAGAALLIVTLVDLVPVQQGPLVALDAGELRGSVAPESLGMRRGERIFHYCTEGFGCLAPGDPGIGAWIGSVRPLEPVAPRARRLWRALVPNVPLVYGLGAVAGTDGFATRAQGELAAALARLPRDQGVLLLRALGVRWLVGMQPLDVPGIDLRHADAESGARLYEVRDAAPRSYVASVGPPASVPTLPMTPLGAADGEVERVSYENARIRAVVRVERDALWVVNDSFFPGWTASIDGRPAEIEPLGGIVRGVRVPAGRHEAEMRYRPRSLFLGAVLSLLTLAGLAAAAFVPRRRGGRSPASPW